MERYTEPYNGIIDERSGNPGKSTETLQKAPEEPLEGLQKLQRLADENKVEKDRSLALYKEYQRNTLASAQLQANILKGIKAGENIYSLFLKAVKAISLMTDNSGFYDQVEADVRTICGHGILYAPPLQDELQGAKERLVKLTEALTRETDSDTLQRIQRAVKAHEDKIKELEHLITT